MQTESRFHVDEQVLRTVLRVNPALRQGRTTLKVKKALEEGEALSLEPRGVL